MTHDELDRKLLAFLDGQEADVANGFTLAALHRWLRTLTDGLHEHKQDCEKRWGDNERKHESTHRRLVVLEASKPSPSVPPPRGISSHDLEQFADRVAASAIAGLQSPDKTPEDMYRQVVAEEQAAIDQRRELERLQRLEAEAIEVAKKLASDRSDLRRKVAIGILSGVGVAATIEAMRWLSLLHH